MLRDLVSRCNIVTDVTLVWFLCLTVHIFVFIGTSWFFFMLNLETRLRMFSNSCLQPLESIPQFCYEKCKDQLSSIERHPLPLSEFLENSNEITDDLYLSSEILGKFGTVLGEFSSPNLWYENEALKICPKRTTVTEKRNLMTDFISLIL